ncbi:hypothetical protein ACFSKM_15660 [Ancylobacter dichloromethanicus]
MQMPLQILQLRRAEHDEAAGDDIEHDGEDEGDDAPRRHLPHPSCARLQEV